MTSPPQNLQHSALLAIDAAVTELVRANEGIDRVITLARNHGLPDEEIIGAFQRAGLDVPGVLAAVERAEV